MKNLYCLIVFMTLFFLGNQITFSQQETFKSIIEQLIRGKITNPNKLTYILENTYSLQDGRYKDSVSMVLEILDTSYPTKIKDKRVLFLKNLITSRNNLLNHEYSEGIKFARGALELEEKGNSKERMYLYTTLGSIHYFKSDYVNALDWHLKALELCEKEKDRSCLANIYNNIAVVYFGTDNIDKIEEYTEKAYGIADSVNNLMEKSRAAGNMAIVFAEQGKLDESEKWFLEDIKIDLELGDSLSVSRNYNNLGRLFEYKSDFQESLKYYKKGLRMAQKADDKASIALGLQNVAWSEHKNGNNKQAINLFNEGIKMTRELGNRDKLRDAYLNLSDMYNSLNQPKNALQYFYKYHDLNDSLVGESHLKALSELEIKYETQKKENELLKLSKQKQENELVIAHQNRRVQQLSFGLGALVLLSVLGFFLFKQRLQNKKQEELLMAISETQTEERKRIAQDLHDSIGGSLALTKTKFEAAKNKLPGPSKELESALETLDQTTHQVRQISHNLMPGELVRFGLVAAISTLLENLNREEINAQFHTNQKEGRLEPIKEIQLYRIVQEALQNVLKHAKAKNLFIQLNKHKNHLSLMIEDDGKGLDNNGTEGMGLKNIKQRVQLLKGIFTVDSSPERGTVLNIQIPA